MDILVRKWWNLTDNTWRAAPFGLAEPTAGNKEQSRGIWITPTIGVRVEMPDYGIMHKYRLNDFFSIDTVKKLLSILFIRSFSQFLGLYLLFGVKMDWGRHISQIISLFSHGQTASFSRERLARRRWSCPSRRQGTGTTGRLPENTTVNMNKNWNSIFLDYLI